MKLNTSAITTASDGAWQGDNPLHHALPLLIVQTIIVVFLSRILAFLLKPLRQPKVVAEIIGGILLGPSAIGRNKKFMEIVFPSWSTTMLESVASFGLLFYLFLVGLELDLHTIRRSGKRAFNIAVAGITLPFIFAVGVTFLLQRAIRFENNHNIGYIQHFVFLGVSLSITAFPVLARILAELKLLTTRVGETAMAAAAFNDVAAWVFLALAVALAGHAQKSSLFTSVWVLFSGVAFVGGMMMLVRPVMNRVASKCCGEEDMLPEIYVCLTLAGVILSGFVTDAIGLHSIFGGFVFGLTIPKESEFARKLTTRIEDFVSTLLLPMYFASSGLRTDVTKLRSIADWVFLLLVTSTACAGKILGTFAVAVMCMVPVRESLTLGVLMNTKGLVELIVLNIGREKKVLNDEIFTILVLMALFTTFITTPMVLAVYKPSRIVNSQKPSRLTDMQEKINILACIHGTGNIPSLINFIESIRATNSSRIKLYVMQLTELTDSSSSILMVQRSRKNGFPSINRIKRGGTHEQIATAFQAYGELGQVTVHHLTSISLLSTMHEDICHVAEKKGVAMIILPFHRRWGGEGEAVTEDLGQSWREVNQRVLQNAHCSVAVLVNRGFARRLEQGPESSLGARKRVCIIFIGGPHDRKVLELGSRMAAHPAIRLLLVRFTSCKEPEVQGRHNSPTCTRNLQREKELDEETVNEFKAKWKESVEYIEKNTSNITEEVISIGKAKDYDLVIVGKQQEFETTMLTNIDFGPEHAELGPIGNIFASSGNGIASSLLVIQDRHLKNPDESTLVKTARAKNTVINDTI